MAKDSRHFRHAGMAPAKIKSRCAILDAVHDLYAATANSPLLVTQVRCLAAEHPVDKYRIAQNHGQGDDGAPEGKQQ